MSRQTWFPWLAGAASAALFACSGDLSGGRPLRDGWTVDADGNPVPPDGPVPRPGDAVSGDPTDPAAGDGPGGPGGPGDSPGNSGSNINVVTCTAPELGPSPLRRLRHPEYDNSVRDLLGLDLAVGARFAPDTQVGLFDNTASAQTVSILLAEQYLSAAEELAQAADVDALLGCDPAGATGATCVGDFVSRFGRRAFRRPLSADERDRLLALHGELSAAADARTGVRGVIAAVLASPNFLFHPEFGADAAAVPDGKHLTSYELASRLASLLWASVPDETLLEAAASDALQDAAELEAQARRMLDDPRARPALSDFYEQWLGMSAIDTATKDPAEYPAFSDSLRDAMAEETRRYVSHVLWEDDARLSTLLTAPYSFVNGDLAQHYGLVDDCNAAPTTLAWNHASAYWSPAPDAPTPQTVSTEGWFVWELQAGELDRDVVRFEVALNASAGGVPAQVDVNHAPLLAGLTLNAGDNVLRGELAVSAGEWLKIGVQVAPGAGGVRFERLTLFHDATQRAPAGCGAEFRRVDLDPRERRGLLTQASLLAGHGSPAASSPVKRGKWVRVRMLCQDLPDPPANIPELPAPAPGVSTRERFAMHTDSPACSGCHTLIDGLGFGFEHYDGIGAFRTMDQGATVDASGEINHTRDIDGTYDGVPELAELLAGSEQVSDCVPTQWLRYALGRRETPEDACSLVAARDAFAQSDGDLRELMVALTQTDAFRYYRQPE